MDFIEKTPAHTWRRLLGKDSQPWVLFEYGSVILGDRDSVDAKADAIAIMRDWGPVRLGSPYADFTIRKVANDLGWLVLCHHRAILTYVHPGEFADGMPREVEVGVTGRHKRKLDSESPKVVHIEIEASNSGEFETDA